ncbi:MAG: hypothetical protein ACRCX2_29965 [Paraclostridium sp.]
MNKCNNKFLCKLEGKLEYLNEEVATYERMIESLETQIKFDAFNSEQSGMNKDDARKASRRVLQGFKSRLSDLNIHVRVYKDAYERESNQRKGGCK